ncbi:MAG: PAS domain S-box protein [Verrucomicrobiota bacterium]|nr:PAS domain S-box protein [Verrucomicrobiota bacterium]
MTCADETLLMHARIIESMAEGVVVADEAGLIVTTNPAFDRMFGYGPEELVGRRLAILLDADESASGRCVEEIQETLQRETHWTGELARRRKDGTRFVTRTHISAFETGGKKFYFGVQEDITKRKATEKALHEAEEKYRSIFENAVEGIFQSTPEGKFIAANPAVARILGYTSVAELLSDYDLELHGYVDPSRRTEFRRMIAEEGVVNGFEYEVYRKDGAKVWISENARTVRDARGQILYFEGTFEDITERKKAGQRIREQAELLNLAHDAIIVRDLEDRVEFWNQGAEKLYGWSAPEVIGKKIYELIYQKAQFFAGAKEELLRTGEWRGELEHLCKDGRSIVVNSRWTLVRDEEGRPQSILVIHTDITEQKKLEAQFLRSQRLESIGTLAAGVAHDLNNILAPILLVAPLLRGKLSATDKEELLNLVQASAERGASVVKQMLTFARGADGERVLLQPMYLLQEVAKIAEQTFPKTIAIATHYPQDLWLVEGDPTQLQQVLLNLCVNARDAMPSGGRMCLTSENFEVDEHFASMIPGATAGPHVLMEVTDDGVGIPHQVIDKIFDPFFTTKDVGKGTGLGLSTVLGIVKSYGGFMNVCSEPGQTSFKVFLPARGGATLATTASEQRSLPGGRGETILVVDDEPSVREAAQSLLSRHGYKVLVAEDGIAGLALFARHAGEIDVVLTDMVMPFMDGVTLIRTVRRIQPHSRIIISTGRDEACRSPEIEALAVDACLLKPYTREKFLMTLDEVLQRERAVAA